MLLIKMFHQNCQAAFVGSYWLRLGGFPSIHDQRKVFFTIVKFQVVFEVSVMQTRGLFEPP